MHDDRAVDRWTSLEMQRLAKTLVIAPRRLADLQGDAAPSAPTRDGGRHAFDTGAIQAMTAALSPLTRAGLKVPITIFLDHAAPGDCYVSDTVAMTALSELGAGRAAPRDGRLWMGVPLARDLARRFPTLVQFAYA